tara:strand:+ start:584 stop:1108 length:525 start_codon:yes stop_codon:yes gene_type:complete
MAVVVPTSKIDIAPRRAFGRTRPILSGESADDLSIGQRGLIQQVNLAYSRGRCLFSLRQWADPGSLDHGAFFFTTASTSYVPVTNYVNVNVGNDVSSLTLIADVDDITLRLTEEGGSSGTGVGRTGRGEIIATLSLGSTGSKSIRVDAITGVGQTGKVYSIAVFETTLVAADFP